VDLQNSKELIENIKAQDVSKIDSIKMHAFSIPYTTILQDELKHRLIQIIGTCLLFLFLTKWHPKMQRYIFCETPL
jgi:hypothetical protein